MTRLDRWREIPLSRQSTMTTSVVATSDEASTGGSSTTTSAVRRSTTGLFTNSAKTRPSHPQQPPASKPPTLSVGSLFNDGLRRVDFVMVYQEKASESNVQRQQRRHFFEQNLLKAGLQLEEDCRSQDHHQDVQVGEHRRTAANATAAAQTIYVKVHAPFDVLCRQAEELKMRMPLRIHDALAGALDAKPSSKTVIGKAAKDAVGRVLRIRRRSTAVTHLDEAVGHQQQPSNENGHLDALPSNAKSITWPFEVKKLHTFLVVDPETFFSPIQRMEIVWEVLQTARNDPKDEKRRGVELLIKMDVYDAAFPLHDGDPNPSSSSDHGQHRGHHEQQQPIDADRVGCQRQLLKQYWANWRCIFRSQPIDLIRNYFGEKIAFYFAFLEFYTKMLFIPAALGVFVFIYGLAYADDNGIVDDTCDVQTDPGNRFMCPICKIPYCNFTLLSDSCSNVHWNYRLDNETTLIMSCVSAVWAIVFLKLWKRREAELAYGWDTHNVELEDLAVRPDYEERATDRRHNPITQQIEPHVPLLVQYSRLSVSVLVTAFMLGLVVVSLVCLILARLGLYSSLRQQGVAAYVEVSEWIVNGIVFVVVTLLENVYRRIAVTTTSFECPRTQSHWLSSYLWKVYVFQLWNQFAPIGHAAWVKGSTVNTPVEFSLMSHVCQLSNCMNEVTQQVAVLLVTRLVIGSASEVLMPFVRQAMFNLYHDKLDRRHASLRRRQSALDAQNPQWQQDMRLDEPELDGVASEYMEIVCQFAFCTLFVPAFPLAPAVCLLSNIAEIRVDAINFVVTRRRPLPIRVPGIQIWNYFFNIVAKLAILCNAGLIAFTSEIIPRMYYRLMKTKNDLSGYPSFKLSFIESRYWDEEDRAAFENLNITGCWYADHRRSEPPFEVEQVWWEVMTMRLSAFAIYVVAAWTFQWMVDMLVPDTPISVVTKMQRCRYVILNAMETEVVYDRWLKNSLTTKPEWAPYITGPNQQHPTGNRTSSSGRIRHQMSSESFGAS